jgi:hypothetical protein
MSLAPGLHKIGQFEVIARTADIARFRETLDALPEPNGTSSAVPTSFPTTWLTLPDIRAAIVTIPCFSLGPCVLIGQTVTGANTIEADTPYRMTVDWRMVDEAKRVFEVIATVTQAEGGVLMCLASTLAIAPKGAPTT